MKKTNQTDLTYDLRVLPPNEEGDVAVNCCTDGLRPVIFKIERIYAPALHQEANEVAEAAQLEVPEGPLLEVKYVLRGLVPEEGPGDPDAVDDGEEYEGEEEVVPEEAGVDLDEEGQGVSDYCANPH